MKIKCMIFDMDGLMFDTEKIGYKALEEVASTYGYKLEKSIFSKICGGSTESSFKILRDHFGADYPAEKIREKAVFNRKKYIKEGGLPIKKGLKELLLFLKEQNIHVAVASSTHYDLVLEYLKISEVLQYVDYIVGGNQVVKTKPNPEIFLKPLEYFNINADEAIVLEDSRNGILAAVNAGIPVICVPDLVVHNEEINKLTFKVVDSLVDVIEIVKDISKKENMIIKDNKLV